MNIENTYELKSDWLFHWGDLGGVWESCRPVKRGDPEDAVDWTSVELPHCFNDLDSVDPDRAYYQGYGWYRTEIKPENPFSCGHTLLHFEGAGQTSEVYIGSVKVGEHRGGYDEWTVDITDYLKGIKSDNVIISVRCSNVRDLQLLPSDLSDFSLHGGLYRPVRLVYTPRIYVDQLHITPRISESDSSGEITIRASLNLAEEAAAGVEITASDGTPVLIDNVLICDGKLHCTVKIPDPFLWSTIDPQLYTCRLSVSGMDTVETFGFRSFHFEKHGPFFLNGKRLLLKGTHRHEDHAGFAAAMPAPLIEEEMKMIKSMGANFIRLGHYQQSRQVLDLCDSLGILVWEEIPWCRGGLGDDSYQNMGLKMLENMIGQHYNHPSVILWGLGNENDWPGDFEDFDKEAIRGYMKSLHERAHFLDRNRLTAIRRCDFCKDIPDVYSPSIWAGWYRGHYREYREASLKHIAEVDHFLHAEWGASSHAGRFSEDPYEGLEHLKTGIGTDERGSDASLYGGISRVSKDGNWSENYACDLFDWTLKEQELMPQLTGTAFWPFKDFATPLRPENPVPYVNQKGVTERDLTPKETYFVVQSYWSDTPMLRIFGHKWSDRWGMEGEKKEFRVYSNCSKVELFLDGSSLGVKTRDSQDFPAAGLRWQAELTDGFHILNAVAPEEDLSDGYTFRYHSETWGEPYRLHGRIMQVKGLEITASVWVADSEKRICLDSTDYVRFSLAGEGRLIDNQGTSLGSRKVQLCNGKSGIRVIAESEASVLGVTCGKLPPLFIHL